VGSEKDVSTVLSSIIRHGVDALWLIPDSDLLTWESLQYIPTTALEFNVPVIGFSSELVRNGALMGMFLNYDDVGRQAGMLASKILAGHLNLSMKPLQPDRFDVALNLNTARVLGIAIPSKFSASMRTSDK
jgi:putative ABC transport system substrate-binding protein